MKKFLTFTTCAIQWTQSITISKYHILKSEISSLKISGSVILVKSLIGNLDSNNLFSQPKTLISFIVSFYIILKKYILFNSFSSVSQKYTVSRKAKFKIIEKMFMNEIVINKVSH